MAGWMGRAIPVFPCAKVLKWQRASASEDTSYARGFPLSISVVAQLAACTVSQPRLKEKEKRKPSSDFLRRSGANSCGEAKRENPELATSRRTFPRHTRALAALKRHCTLEIMVRCLLHSHQLCARFSDAVMSFSFIPFFCKWPCVRFRGAPSLNNTTGCCCALQSRPRGRSAALNTHCVETLRKAVIPSFILLCTHNDTMNTP